MHMRTFELSSSGSHGGSLCWEFPCGGAGVRFDRQVEYWQHARDLGLWWDILEIKVG